MDKQLEEDRIRAFKQYKIYFIFLWEYGKGIIIKPQLEQYILQYTDYSKSTFNKHLSYLVSLKLIKIERTHSASIICVTKPLLVLLLGKREQKEVSLTGIWTNIRLSKSIFINEYILREIVPVAPTVKALNLLVGESNLLKSSGDNLDLAELIHARLSGANLNGSSRDIKYIKECMHNKKANLKNNKLEPVEIIRDKKYGSLNNLQARHMYVVDSSPNFIIAYLEVSAPITYPKFVADINVLQKYLGHADVNSLTVDVVVGAGSSLAIENILEEWNRKKGPKFLIHKNNLVFNIVPLDLDNKYFKGVRPSVF